MPGQRKQCREEARKELENGKRRTHKFSFTDPEFQLITERALENGFHKPADWIVSVAEVGSVEKVALRRQRQKFAVQVNRLATYANRIRAGIDVPGSSMALAEGVEELCRTYAL